MVRFTTRRASQEAARAAKLRHWVEAQAQRMMTAVPALEETAVRAWFADLEAAEPATVRRWLAADRSMGLLADDPVSGEGKEAAW
jgi:hypothetical protein